MKCDLEYGIWGECFEKWLAKIWKVSSYFKTERKL